MAIFRDELVGVAGLNYDKSAFVDLGMEAFWKNFGYMKGSVKAFAADILFSRKPSQDELLMDGIVVDKNFRGKGIGKALFGIIEEFAFEGNFKQIRLDVVDENPRAKKVV